MDSWAGLTLTIDRRYQQWTQGLPLVSIAAYWLRDGRLSSAYHALFGSQQLPVSEMRGAAGSHAPCQHSSEAPFWGSLAFRDFKSTEPERLSLQRYARVSWEIPEQ